MASSSTPYASANPALFCERVAAVEVEEPPDRLTESGALSDGAYLADDKFEEIDVGVLHQPLTAQEASKIAPTRLLATSTLP